MVTDEELKKEMDMKDHLRFLKEQIEPHILKDLEQYAEQKDDSVDRVVLRISEILAGQYHHQFNVDIANLIKAFGYGGNDYYDDGTGEFDLRQFNLDWMNRGLKFD